MTTTIPPEASAGATAPPDAEAAFEALLVALAPRFAPGLTPPVLVGIHTGGAWVAERLHNRLCPQAPLGLLSSAFHRDDFSRRGLRAGTQRGSTRIDFEVEGADILLVDDVLYTGRTLRAVLNELFDYGRPRRVDLAVLVDRGGRELPVHAEVAGCRLALDPALSLVLGREDDRFVFTLEGA
jgi:pyrimidine operon attenuation protein/uracil phosphoribosyltransferase